ELGRDFHYAYEPGQVTAASDRPPRVRVTTGRRAWPVLEVGLLGEHQAANAAGAGAAGEGLREAGRAAGGAGGGARPAAGRWPGPAWVGWRAGVEGVGRRPLVVLDCAHNLASAQALADTLLASFPPARRLLIFAASRDKDLAGMLHALAPHFAHAYLTRYGTNP